MSDHMDYKVWPDGTPEPGAFQGTIQHDKAIASGWRKLPGHLPGQVHILMNFDVTPEPPVEDPTLVPGLEEGPVVDLNVNGGDPIDPEPEDDPYVPPVSTGEGDDGTGDQPTDDGSPLDGG